MRRWETGVSKAIFAGEELPGPVGETEVWRDGDDKMWWIEKDTMHSLGELRGGVIHVA